LASTSAAMVLPVPAGPTNSALTRGVARIAQSSVARRESAIHFAISRSWFIELALRARPSPAAFSRSRCRLLVPARAL
jgi:hypothetical protein